MKVALVSRHRLLPAQEKALGELGFEVVRRIENLPTEEGQLRALVEELRREGVEAVVTVALPPHLLSALSQNFPVYVFEMESTTFTSEDEARAWVSEKPEWRTYLPGRSGEPVRGLEFRALSRVRVVIERERVWPPKN